MKYLFIDDIREPEHFIGIEIYVARSYNKAINMLKNVKFDAISFDHDLGEDKTGYDIAKYIIENHIKFKQGFKIHSANPVGKFNIEQLLTHYGYNKINNKLFDF